MNKSILFLGLLALMACQRSVYIANQPGDTRFGDIMRHEIVRAVNIPEYSNDMQPGSSFIIVLCPGIPMSTKDLSFLFSDTVFRCPEEYNKAYLFARLVNAGIPSSQFNTTSCSFLGNGSFLETMLHNDLVENTSLLNLYRLANPYYNDDFYFTTVNPRPQLIDWTTVSMQHFIAGRAKIKKRQIKYQQLSYTFSADLKILNIYRPWLKLRNIMPATLPEGKGSLGIITQVIISRAMVIDDYQGNVSKLNARGKLTGSMQAASAMRTDSTMIIGFVCKII